MREVLAVIISYFIGGILTAGIIASLKHVDLSKEGSGNPGATNAFRVFGPFFGGLVLLGDVAKGILGTLIGYWLGGDAGTAALCGMAVVVGHNWPMLYKFQGGKGIATTLGVIIVLVPQTLLVIIPLFVLTVAVSRYVSLGSLVAAVAVPVATLSFYPQQRLVLLFAVVIPLLAVYRHRANIRRLLAGEEHKIELPCKMGGKRP